MAEYVPPQAHYSPVLDGAVELAVGSSTVFTGKHGASFVLLSAAEARCLLQDLQAALDDYGRQHPTEVY